MRTTNQIEVLSDLIKMAETQLAAYKAAIHAVKSGSDSFLVFSSLADKKGKHIMGLREEINKVGGRLPEAFPTWEEGQVPLAGPAQFQYYESGEKTLVKAYETALQNADLNAAQRFTLRGHYQELLSGMERLRSLRQATYTPPAGAHVFLPVRWHREPTLSNRSEPTTPVAVYAQKLPVE